MDTIGIIGIIEGLFVAVLRFRRGFRNTLKYSVNKGCTRFILISRF